MTKFKSIVASIAAVLAALSVVTTPAHAAGSASFSLSPSRATVVQNETFTVVIYENGSNVNAVTAKLTFDSSKVQFMGIDASGSAFPNGIAETNGMTRYTNGTDVVNGSAYVASAQFKAVAASGTAIVSIAAGSKIASGGADTWNGAASATSVQLSAPAPSAPAPGRGAGTPTPPQATPSHQPASIGGSSQQISSASTAPASTPEVKAATDSKPETTVASTTPTADTKAGNNLLPTVLGLALAAAVIAAGYFFRKRLVAAGAPASVPVAAPVATKSTAKKAAQKPAAKKPVAKKAAPKKK